MIVNILLFLKCNVKLNTHLLGLKFKQCFIKIFVENKPNVNTNKHAAFSWRNGRPHIVCSITLKKYSKTYSHSFVHQNIEK